LAEIARAPSLRQFQWTSVLSAVGDLFGELPRQFAAWFFAGCACAVRLRRVGGGIARRGAGLFPE